MNFSCILETFHRLESQFTGLNGTCGLSGTLTLYYKAAFWKGSAISHPVKARVAPCPRVRIQVMTFSTFHFHFAFCPVYAHEMGKV